ncbi:hypothetical protein BDF20DRAFT_815696, partial [Mycotypha africana]|uniref:uncharacterized protein n=1 Tax=Mycotypha africana TaxID=64632 RepID=UPI0022FFE3D1
LGYILTLSKSSPLLMEESWPLLFRQLIKEDTAGTIFLYEKVNRYSLVRTSSDKAETVADLFPTWLSKIAFDPHGLIMKHAVDVAVMLDTLAHDPRLDLTHLIPLFLLQLVILKDEVVKDTAIDMFAQLITQLDRSESKSFMGARYLILELLTSTEAKWPGIFQIVLDNIFSRAIAMHIADSEGAVNVEKILGNLALLFEHDSTAPNEPTAGFQAFHSYMTTHWRQVTLLFLNHPSMECRAVGYRVLTNSKFWLPITNKDDLQTIAKLFVDAWFRNLKGRYVQCGQPQEEKDINAIQQEKISLLNRMQATGAQVDAYKQQTRQPNSFIMTKPPQFVTSINCLSQEEVENQGFLTIRDKIYVDNIERTASLFYFSKYLPTTTCDGFMQVVVHILSYLCRKWEPNSIPLDTYDDVLPHNIPYQCDITIGSAFKDHPVLFLIFEKYTNAIRESANEQLLHQFPTNEIVRSILIYLIVFWYMREVVTIPTTLRFATQLEETTRLLLLLEPVSTI